MKIKLGILFLVLAVVTVAGVFYTKDYLSYDVARTQKAQGAMPTLDGVITAGSQFYDYSDQVYANDELIRRIMDAYRAGDLVIIHFWASWCAPCVNEIPEIIEFMKKNKAEGGSKAAIQFVAVNMDSSLEDIQKFLKSFPEFNQDPFVRIWDKNSELSKYFDVDKLPASVFLQNGKPYRKSNGAISWLRDGN
jgi:thiol-disulfide isomerase/thioredoxin